MCVTSNIKIATDAIQAASRSHHFLSVHKNGQVAIVETAGNPDCHVILRGGKAPNYDAESVAAACKDLEAAKLPASLMVDFSHANSSKQHERQVVVAKDIADYERFLRDHLLQRPHVHEAHSHIAMSEVKRTTELPLD